LLRLSAFWLKSHNELFQVFGEVANVVRDFVVKIGWLGIGGFGLSIVAYNIFSRKGAEAQRKKFNL
jgi:hypothetical protein